MNLRPALYGLCSFVLLSTIAPSAAQTPRAHTVQDILRDGKSVASADGVKVTTPAGSVETSIRRDEPIADGTRIDVPAGIEVVVVSTGGKSTATLKPGSSVTFVTTGSGELVSSNGGKAIFNIVPKSLDFFRVRSGESIMAGVHGTVFWIDSEALDPSAPTVAVDCTRGAVDVTKTGYLQIGAQTRVVSLIDTISADGGRTEVTYHPTKNWLLGKFASFAEAEAFFQKQVDAARQSGDNYALSAALRNLGLILWFEGRYGDALRASSRDSQSFGNSVTATARAARSTTSV